MNALEIRTILSLIFRAISWFVWTIGVGFNVASAKDYFRHMNKGQIEAMIATSGGFLFAANLMLAGFALHKVGEFMRQYDED